jgi:glucosamine 6-phosphate synthetase-like amidotransferase/phosphosugar isomerase protein
MCSIYGSKNRNMFDVLHDASLERGKYACSFASVLPNKTIIIQKQEGHPKNMDVVKLPNNTRYFLGHNQAPTSSQRNYNKTTSHPFQYEHWVVAHNGVITNVDKLNKVYTPFNDNPVDSAVIPALLWYFTENFKNLSEITVIQSVLDLIEGTFAVWIYNAKSGKIYLARQGSTLFANPETGDFCSIPSKDWKELDEGVIYQICSKNIAAKTTFKNTTPFLTL